MKILVTGGNGEFCKHLVEQGKGHSFLTPPKQSAYPGLDVRDYWNVDWYFKQKQDELQQAKQLFEECGFQYKAKAYKEMDKFLNKLITENGVTKI